MSIKITKATIGVDNLIELDELHDSMESKMEAYALKHRDFSVLFEKHIDDNILVVKTLYLEEHVN